jgi:hypothetical protein
MGTPAFVLNGAGLIADVPVMYFIFAASVLMFLSMKEQNPALLALSGLMAGLAGCSSGGDGGSDGGNYDFNGTWSGTSKVTESNLSTFPVGTTGTTTLVITQSGTTISGVLDSELTLSGTCDPTKGTFSMTGKLGAVTYGATMQKEDADTLSGTLTITGGSYLIRFNTTLNLVSRNKSAAMTGGSSAGTVSSLVEALSTAP